MSPSLRRAGYAEIANDPGLTDSALHLQAYLEYVVGDFQEAKRILDAVIRRAPSDARYYFDRGLTCWRLNELDECAEAFTRAGGLDPGYADAFFNAAIVEKRREDHAKAKSLLRQAYKSDPLLRLRSLRDRWDFFFKQKPQRLLGRYGWRIPTRDFPEVHDAIAYGFMKRGEHELGAEACQRALALAPTKTRYATLGTIYTIMEESEKALPPLERAYEMDPALVVEMLAYALDNTRKFDRAKLHYKEALATNPRSILSLSRLLTLATIEGELEAAEEYFAQLAKAVVNIETHPQATAWELLTTVAYRNVLWPLPRPEARALMRQIDKNLEEITSKRGGHVAQRRDLAPGKGRIRIGYLSACLRDHPIGHVTLDHFGKHDRTRFEVHVFHAFNLSTTHTKQIAESVEYFHDATGKISDTARLIKAQNIDILIYLDGYTNHRLMQVMALRPAPIQAYWLGHAGDCDLSTIDYMIADAIVVPPGEERLYNTKLVRLPGCYHSAMPHALAPLPSRTASGLPERGFVFCAFNNPEKIDREIFDVWMRILHAVEGSVLWLSASKSQHLPTNMRAAAEARGIAGERLIFADRLSDKGVHFARHKHCGLLLDTITLNASTTALDALWSGLPVLTIRGDRFASRIATSMVTAVGMEDMVCESLEEYEARAVFLAKNSAELEKITARLESNRLTHSLFDADNFCRKMERALEAIYSDAEPSSRTPIEIAPTKAT